jgi:dephospho-CoA kinase
MTPSSKTLTFGLTGGVGCGKSHALRILQSMGWLVIDTDQLGHELLEAGTEAHKKIIDAFGPSVLNNNKSIDRSLLGQIVFSDEGRRKQLDSILHPIIRSLWQSRLTEHRLSSPGTPAAVEIPLLFETGAATEFDHTVCVGCSAAMQHQRLVARGWDLEKIHRRLHAQWPLTDKIKHSDIVIWNDGSPGLLQCQLERLPA